MRRFLYLLTFALAALPQAKSQVHLVLDQNTIIKSTALTQDNADTIIDGLNANASTGKQLDARLIPSQGSGGEMDATSAYITDLFTRYLLLDNTISFLNAGSNGRSRLALRPFYSTGYHSGYTDGTGLVDLDLGDGSAVYAGTYYGDGSHLTNLPAGGSQSSVDGLRYGNGTGADTAATTAQIGALLSGGTFNFNSFTTTGNPTVHGLNVGTDGIGSQGTIVAPSFYLSAATNPAVNYGNSLFLTRTATGTVAVGTTQGGKDGTVAAAAVQSLTSLALNSGPNTNIVLTPGANGIVRVLGNFTVTGDATITGGLTTTGTILSSGNINAYYGEIYGSAVRAGVYLVSNGNLSVQGVTSLDQGSITTDGAGDLFLAGNLSTTHIYGGGDGEIDLSDPSGVHLHADGNDALYATYNGVTVNDLTATGNIMVNGMATFASGNFAVDWDGNVIGNDVTVLSVHAAQGVYASDINTSSLETSDSFVANGEIYSNVALHVTGDGMILSASNGSQWVLQVSETGALSTHPYDP